MKTKLFLLLFLASLSTYAQTNLVPNGGFETWTNSTTLSNWIIENNVIQNTASFSEGSKSTQLSIATNTIKPKIIAQVPMTAGTTYTVKFKYKYVNSNYSGQHPISLNIGKTGSATTLSSSTFASDNNWTLKENTFTPDQNLAYDLSISLASFDDATFNVLIDDVQVYILGTEPTTLIPDTKFEDKLIALGIDTDGKNGKVATESIAVVTHLLISSSSISDLTGIQDFVGLTNLTCSSNQLTALDVSKNVKLTSLVCPDNQIASLDISKNVSLKTLFCGVNQIATLDVSKNIDLTGLDLSHNKLASIDVSKNVNLTMFYCNDNKLTSLNLKNGKNTLLTTANISLTTNPNLKCIQVDDVTYANTNWSNKKDATTNFSLSCPSLGIKETVFDNIAIYPNPTKGELYIDNIILEKATLYDALGKLVKTTKFSSGTNNNTMHLSGLPSGIYYIYLESENANTAKKIIVE